LRFGVDWKWGHKAIGVRHDKTVLAKFGWWLWKKKYKNDKILL